MGSAAGGRLPGGRARWAPALPGGPRRGAAPPTAAEPPAQRAHSASAQGLPRAASTGPGPCTGCKYKYPACQMDSASRDFSGNYGSGEAAVISSSTFSVGIADSSPALASPNSDFSLSSSSSHRLLLQSFALEAGFSPEDSSDLVPELVLSVPFSSGAGVGSDYSSCGRAERIHTGWPFSSSSMPRIWRPSGD